LRRLREELAFVRGNLLVLILSWTIWAPFSHAVHVYEQVYILALGASVAVLGVIAAISSVILGVVRFVGGYVADRYGRKRILVSMTFIYSSALFLYALAQDWIWILVASVITSICLLYQPALSAITSDSIPPEKRGVGFALTSLLPELMGLPGPLLAIYLVSTYGLIMGMRIAYSLMAASGLVAAALRLTLKETWRPDAGKKEDFFHGYREALRFASRDLKAFIAVAVSTNLTAGFFSVIQPFVIYYLGLSLEEWGFLYMLGGVIWLLVVLPVGFLVDRVGRRKSLISGLTASLVAFSLLLLARPLGIVGFWPILGTMFLLWLGSYMLHNSLSSLEADLVPRPLRGKLSAVLALLVDVAGAASSAACGFLYEAIHPTATVGVAMSSLLASLLVALAYLREPEHKHE